MANISQSLSFLEAGAVGGVGDHFTQLQPPILDKVPSGIQETEADNGTGDEKYPDGGLSAWLVVLGSWCAMVPSMGLLNTFGVLHAWTSKHQLLAYSESKIGWVFGTYAFFLYFGAAQIGNEPISLLFNIV